MSEFTKQFKCVIISPAGRLLDCSAVGVTFIAYDGSVGVLSNHMPMLCELGLGIMEIELPRTDPKKIVKKLALIDGGFALIHSNRVGIIAIDAIKGWDMKQEKIELLLENYKKKLKGLPEISDLHSHQVKKNTLLEKLFSLQAV